MSNKEQQFTVKNLLNGYARCNMCLTAKYILKTNWFSEKPSSYSVKSQALTNVMLR